MWAPNRHLRVLCLPNSLRSDQANGRRVGAGKEGDSTHFTAHILVQA